MYGGILVSKFPERLKELRRQRGWSQRELAQKIGMSSGTVAAWEVGRNEPNYDMLRKLADLLDTSVDYLIGLSDIPSPPGKEVPWAVKLRPIPVYNGASVGINGSFPDGSDVVKWIMIPANKSGKFGVIIHGDSMEPEIRGNDIAVIDPDFAVDSGNLALVILDDEAYVKKVYFHDGAVILQSLNPKYPPITIPARKLKMCVVGKVVGLHRLY